MRNRQAEWSGATASRCGARSPTTSAPTSAAACSTARASCRPNTSWRERFGVNRHTVREAIAALVQEGVLRAEQGRGTFVQQRRRFAYPIGPRTRFSAGLDGQAHELRGHALGHAYEEASDQVAAGLEIKAGARVLRLETLSEADGRPLSRATSYFDGNAV